LEKPRDIKERFTDAAIADRAAFVDDGLASPRRIEMLGIIAFSCIDQTNIQRVRA
jgi:hypothetical protein